MPHLRERERERERERRRGRGWLAIKEGSFTRVSFTTSRKVMMLGPPDNFCRMLISFWILILVRTGFNTLMVHFSRSTRLIPSKYSEYLPRPAPNYDEYLRINY
jgi:hypothetical protein